MIDDELNNLFISLVNDIQEHYTMDKALQIDKTLFDIYQLTEEERKTIGFIEIV